MTKLLQVKVGVGVGVGGGALITICHEIHNLHLRAGASQRRDSASERRDEIPPFTCIRNFIIPPTIPHRSSLENVSTFTCNCHWESRLWLAPVFASSPDYTPPLIIRNRPDFHLQLLRGHLYWVFSPSNLINAPIQPDYQLQSCLTTVISSRISLLTIIQAVMCPTASRNGASWTKSLHDWSPLMLWKLLDF